MPGLLCLKWNNHSSAFDKLLGNIHLKNIYADGTLICHGKFYPIHRFVLSTCSEYFDEIFKQCSQLDCKHPFIIVKDVQPIQMEALLNYMYRGEVNVPQEMLPELIKAAEAFKIKGLAVPDDELSTSKSLTRDRKRNSSSSSPSPRNKKSRKFEDRNYRVNRMELEPNVNDIKENLNGHESNNSNQILRNQQQKDSLVNVEDTPEDYYNSESSDVNNSKIPITEVAIKCEPIDINVFSEDLSSKQISSLECMNSSEVDKVKSEDQSYDSYASSDHFPSYEEESDQGADTQFDASKISWSEDPQVLEGEANLANEDSEQRVSLLQKYSQKLLMPLSKGTNSDNVCENLSSRTINSEKHVNKPFGCDFCPYRCLTKSELIIHTRKHTGEKPFKCPSCPYRASQNNNLQTHLKIHTGERPFPCQYCSYKATQKHCLLTHMKRHQQMQFS